MEIEISEGLKTTSRWLNNEFLIIVPQDNMNSRYLLNPFTGQRRPFPHIPDERVDERFANVYWFNPQGTTVAYLETDEDFRTYYSRERYVLYETNSQTRIETGLNWAGGSPAWSPDGDYLAAVSLGRLHVVRQIPSQEIFLVEATTGKPQQISNFFELFEGA